MWNVKFLRSKGTVGLFLVSTAVFSAAHGTAVLTQHNNVTRTGGVLLETHLNTDNVNQEKFGKLGAYPVDDQIYTQPLLVPDVSIGSNIYNVVYVATVNNSVYAFDADDYRRTKPLWSRNYNDPDKGIIPPVASDVGQNCGVYKDFSGNMGIVGTPVIDDQSSTMYFVVRTKQNGKFSQWFHAVDIRTGEERPNSPTEIKFSVTGTGQGSQNGKINFDPKIQNQRMSLLLSQGTVYMGWASHCTTGPYHGYLVGFDAKSLELKRVFITTPNGSEGGLWQAGQGPSADEDGNLYVLSANGTTTAQKGGQDYGQSFLKLIPTEQGFQVASYFTPHDNEYLTAADLDLGSAGMLLIPGSKLAVGGGKIGQFYVVNRDDMGGWKEDNDSQIVQTFEVAKNHHIHGSPVYWEGPNGRFVYVWPENSPLSVFKFNGEKFDLPAYAHSTMNSSQGMPGAMLSVSSLGNKAGSGILWTSQPASGDANHGLRPGILTAFDASDVTKELWNSRQNLQRDDLGIFAKFAPPTIANGRVYLSTFSNQLVVYGLFSEAGNTNPHGNPEDPDSIPDPVPQGPIGIGSLYSFVSQHSSKCIDIPSNSSSNGTKLQQYDCNNTEAQIFRAQDAGSGLYNLVTLGNSKCLEIENASMENGGRLQQNPCSMNSKNQKFAVTAGENGVLIIKPAQSNLCLDIMDQNLDNGAALHQWQCFDIASQHWIAKQQ